MVEVIRYKVEGYEFTLVPAHEGAWVQYHDYARLQEQVEALSERPDWPTVNATYEKWKSRAEAAEVRASRLENTLKLHSGDLLSLNNEVELFRTHWLEADERAVAAEAERDRLRDELAESKADYRMAYEAGVTWKAKHDRLREENERLRDACRIARLHAPIIRLAPERRPTIAVLDAALQKEPQP